MSVVGIYRLPAYITHMFATTASHFVTTLFFNKLTLAIITSPVLNIC